MSAYEEFRAEKQALDDFLSSGYMIAAIREDLDGAHVLLKRDAEQTEMHLQTADARKYVIYRLRGM